MRTALCVSLLAISTVLAGLLWHQPHVTAGTQEALPPLERKIDRSPVDLAVVGNGAWLLTVNQTSGTASLVDVAASKVVAEVEVGKRPSAVAVTPDGSRALVSGTYSGELAVLSLAPPKLKVVGRVQLGLFEPRGVAITPDGSRAYVALGSASEVAVIDLDSLEVQQRIPVSPWPRYLALTPDGSRLAVGCNGTRSIMVIDTATNEVLFEEKLAGINFGHMQVSADGLYVYFPYMVYRQNPITERNIKLGWVLASRIGRVRMDKSVYREAISLDPRGEAIADPHGITFNSDERRLISAASGSQELLVYRTAALKFESIGGPGDHIDPLLLASQNNFHRIILGGRPMAVQLGPDDRFAYVANYIKNSLQVVDLEARQIDREINLGSAPEMSLARQGEAIFYDGRRSLDQWYSCHTCHYEGGTNAVTMDTRNDGSEKTFKTVLPLYNVTRTEPWTWHGWQQDMHAAMHKSMTDTMLGPQPTRDDVQALIAYFDQLQLPPNPYRTRDNGLTAAAARGQAIFQSEVAGCTACHSGPYFTDGQTHDVGQGSEKDVYPGYNTPSLIGTHRKVRWLHHGRAKTLEDVLTTYHNPADVTGLGELTEEQRGDLIAYLKSL